jgi:MFS-type transporter involved in bile tolerance (Atg22 family)
MNIKIIICSPLEPTLKKRKIFYICNLLLFLFSRILLNDVASVIPKTGGSPTNILSLSWLVILIGGLTYFIVKNYKLALRFLLLATYIQNKAIIITCLLAILYFPFEVLVFHSQKNFLTFGLDFGTTLLKITGYSYLIWQSFVLIKMLRSEKRVSPDQNIS